jgi:adenylyltransferase/sulfurtransferase
VFEIFAQYDLIVERHRQLRHPVPGERRRGAARQAYVWGSIYRFDGQVSVFWAEHGPCYRCLYPEPARRPAWCRAARRAGVLGVLCASIGAAR